MEKLTNPSTQPWIIFEPGATKQQAQGQCDCACAEPISRSPVIDVHAHRLYRLYPRFQSITLNPECIVGVGAGRPFLMNDAALKLARQFTRPALLQSQVGQNGGDYRAAEQMVRAGLLVPTNCDNLPASGAETLTAWLHLTDCCNLRCAYCYLPHRPENMSQETGYAAIQAALRSVKQNGFSALKLKWGGGESLLQFELLTKLQMYAAQCCEEAGVRLDSVILTNGTLFTEKRLDQLAQLGLRCAVSLDGLGPGQAKQRARLSGSPSTPAVLRGLELIRRKGIGVTVSVTLTRHNLSELEELTDWLVANHLDFGLNFYRPSGDSLVDLPEAGDLIDVLRHVYRRLSAYPEKLEGLSLLDRGVLSFPHRSPCTAGHSALVFDCSGRVSACPMQINQPVASLDNPDLLGSVRQAFGSVFASTGEATDACRACNWNPWCAGGCPLLRNTPAHASYCQVYREMFPELLKLEGMRLASMQSVLL